MKEQIFESFRLHMLIFIIYLLWSDLMLVFILTSSVAGQNTIYLSDVKCSVFVDLLGSGLDLDEL